MHCQNQFSQDDILRYEKLLDIAIDPSLVIPFKGDSLNSIITINSDYLCIANLDSNGSISVFNCDINLTLKGTFPWHHDLIVDSILLTNVFDLLLQF